jgi:hypothetical protein
MGPGPSGAEREGIAVSVVEKAAKTVIRAKAERPKIRRIVSLKRIDGIMGNLLRMRFYLIITPTDAGQFRAGALGDGLPAAGPAAS